MVSIKDPCDRRVFDRPQGLIFERKEIFHLRANPVRLVPSSSSCRPLPPAMPQAHTNSSPDWPAARWPAPSRARATGWLSLLAVSDGLNLVILFFNSVIKFRALCAICLFACGYPVIVAKPCAQAGYAKIQLQAASPAEEATKNERSIKKKTS